MLLVNIDNLNIFLKYDKKSILKDVNVRLYEKEIIALVGGSGSGKTTTGLATMRLLDPVLSIGSGGILWKGEDIYGFTKREMRRIRGGEIAMIFQEPLNAFNPVYTIQDQISEVLIMHTEFRKSERIMRIKELLTQVGIDDVERIMKSYPHQLSGGLRQRAMIAQALAGEPRVIIADEPTSSIDVTLQAKILELFQDLRRKLNLSIILITHDLGMVNHVADRVYVMCEGRVVESGKVGDVMKNPQQPYTQQLMEATV